MSPVVLLAALVASLLVALPPGVAAALAGPVAHGGLVAETPVVGGPYVDADHVLDLAQVGDRLYAGGNFDSVLAAPGGTRVAQRALFSWSRSTGQLDLAFDPVFDGEVRAVLPSPDGQHLYVGGQFFAVDGTTQRNLVRLDAVTGEVDPSWDVQANGPVSTLALQGDTIWAGGAFSWVDGRRRANLVNVDAAGAVTDRVAWVDRTASPPTNVVPAIAVTPDGGTLVVANMAQDAGTTVAAGQLTGGGHNPYGLVMFDVSGAPGTESVLPFHAPRYDVLPGSAWLVQDMAMAPDGSYVVVTHAGGDGAKSHNDALARFDLAQRDDPAAVATWSSRAFDSVFSVAITDAAVYAGGHFCFVAGPAATVIDQDPRLGDHSCFKPRNADPGPNAARFAGTVVRNQLAAFDPATGRALPAWNPGSDAGKGVLALVATPSGLLVGHDGRVLGGRDVGGAALLDLSPPSEVDLAREAPTRASSTLVVDGMPSSPERAVDGNRGNGHDLAWLARTAPGDDDPFWEVDLGAVRPIDEVRVLFRNDCCSGDDQVGVFVSDVPFAGDDDVQQAFTTAGVQATFSAAAVGATWTVPVQRTGRYVRVQRDCTCELALREVEVVEGEAAPPPDSTDPTVAITSPAEGAQVSDPVTLGGTADDDRGLGRLRLTVRNRDTGAWVQPDGTLASTWAVMEWLALAGEPMTATWSTSLPAGLPAGRYRFFVVAEDAAGNRSAQLSVAFTLGEAAPADAAPPTVAIASPAYLETVVAPVTVTGTAADDTEVVAVDIVVRNLDTGEYVAADGTLQAGFARYPVTSAPAPAADVAWSHDLPTDLPAGRYRVIPRAVDAAGRQATAARAFDVAAGGGAPDTTAPEVVLDAPARGATVGNPVLVSGTATDAVGVTRVTLVVVDVATGDRLQADGTFGPAFHRFDVDALSPGTAATWSHELPPLPPGTYRVGPRAHDAADNRGDASGRFTVA